MLQWKCPSFVYSLWFEQADMYKASCPVHQWLLNKAPSSVWFKLDSEYESSSVFQHERSKMKSWTVWIRQRGSKHEGNVQHVLYCGWRLFCVGDWTIFVVCHCNCLTAGWGSSARWLQTNSWKLNLRSCEQQERSCGWLTLRNIIISGTHGQDVSWHMSTIQGTECVLGHARQPICTHGRRLDPYVTLTFDLWLLTARL